VLLKNWNAFDLSIQLIETCDNNKNRNKLSPKYDKSFYFQYDIYKEQIRSIFIRYSHYDFVDFKRKLRNILLKRFDKSIMDDLLMIWDMTSFGYEQKSEQSFMNSNPAEDTKYSHLREQ